MEAVKDTEELCENMETENPLPPDYESVVKQHDYINPDYAHEQKQMEHTIPGYPQTYTPMDVNIPDYPQSQTSVIVAQPMNPSTDVVRPQEEAPVSPIAILLTFLFSCGVFWLFCWPIGCCSFCVAVSSLQQKDRRATCTQLKTANALSIAGLIFGIIFWIIFLIYRTGTKEDEGSEEIAHTYYHHEYPKTYHYDNYKYDGY